MTTERSPYRTQLPQLERLFITDGGLETTLVFLDGVELPGFAAFTLLDSEDGIARLRRYFESYVDMAKRHGRGIVLESPTWRANADWGAPLGYDRDALARLNRRSIELLEEIRAQHETPETPIVISGNLGPRGDGYRPERLMDAATAQAYHAEQIRVFADTSADMVAAFTLNYIDEAIGVARAAQDAVMPVAISFTVETDGRLPTGDGLEAAIRATDEATGAYPAYYMVNCAHPTHFEHALPTGTLARRIRGLRANASCKSHAELDASTELDIGNPPELGQQYRVLRDRLPHLTVVGGCCGTDQRHVEAICASLAA
jgi:homocysteine S-methyltransferase